MFATLLEEFADDYNRQRPHRTLDLEPPLPTARTPTGTVRSWPVLGEAHHRYDRVV